MVNGILISNLSQEQAIALRCELIFGGENYEGVSDYDEEGRSLAFIAFIDPKNQKESLLWFPQDPAIIGQIGFVIDKN